MKVLKTKLRLLLLAASFIVGGAVHGAVNTYLDVDFNSYSIGNDDYRKKLQDLILKAL